LHFSPCYKSGGGSSRHLDGEVASLSERCLLEELLTSPPLAYNVLRLCEGKGLEALNFKISTND
jgi:hypothetical protein